MDAAVMLTPLGALSHDGSLAQFALQADAWNWGEEPETALPEFSDGEEDDDDAFEDVGNDSGSFGGKGEGDRIERKTSTVSGGSAADGGLLLGSATAWSISVDGAVLAIAYEDEFIVARRIPIGTGAQYSKLGGGSGCASIAGRTTITSILCHVAVLRQGRAAVSQLCVLVGYASGDVKVFSEDGTFLTQLPRSHSRAVTKIVYQPGSPLRRAPAEYLVYHAGGIVVAIDAISFLSVLRFALRSLGDGGDPTARSGAPSPSAPSPVVRKYAFPLAGMSDASACPLPLVLGPGGIAASQGVDAAEAALPAARFIACGKSPTLALFVLQEEGRPLSTLAVASSVATKLTSAVFGMAKGWLGSARDSGSSSNLSLQQPQQQQQELPATALVKEAEFDDPTRHAHTVSVDPSGRLAAVTDGLGRVLLVDLAEQPLRVVRWWKSYRNAQVAWLQSESPATATATPQRVLFLVIYAPRRGLLEVWPARSGGARVGAFKVPHDCRLLQGSQAADPLDASRAATGVSGRGAAALASAFLVGTSPAAPHFVRAVRAPFALGVGMQQRAALLDDQLLARLSAAAAAGDFAKTVKEAAAGNAALVRRALERMPDATPAEKVFSAAAGAMDALGLSDVLEGGGGAQAVARTSVVVAYRAAAAYKWCTGAHEKGVPREWSTADADSVAFAASLRQLNSEHQTKDNTGMEVDTDIQSSNLRPQKPKLHIHTDRENKQQNDTVPLSAAAFVRSFAVEAASLRSPNGLRLFVPSSSDILPVARVLFAPLLATRSADALSGVLQRLPLSATCMRELCFAWLADTPAHVLAAALTAGDETAPRSELAVLVRLLAGNDCDEMNAVLDHVGGMKNLLSARLVAYGVLDAHVGEGVSGRARSIVGVLEVCHWLTDGVAGENTLTAESFNKSEKYCVERLVALHQLDSSTPLPPSLPRESPATQLYRADIALLRFEAHPQSLDLLSSAIDQSESVSMPLRLLALLAVWHSDALKPRLSSLVFTVDKTGRPPREHQLKTAAVSAADISPLIVLSRRLLAAIRASAGPSATCAASLSSVCDALSFPPPFFPRLSRLTGRDIDTISLGLVTAHDHLLLCVQLVVDEDLRAARPLHLFPSAPFFNTFWEPASSDGGALAMPPGGPFDAKLREARREFLLHVAKQHATRALPSAAEELAACFGVSVESLVARRAVAAYMAGHDEKAKAMAERVRADMLAAALLPVVAARTSAWIKGMPTAQQRAAEALMPPDVAQWVARGEGAVGGEGKKADYVTEVLGFVSANLPQEHVDSGRVERLSRFFDAMKETFPNA